MTRINTNVSSLVAQNRLTRTNSDLQTSLTRLSTGLRINSGKDDPAGLIASEALRSDITSINKAISNTQRATQIIATADSALGQVSSLLNDVRGLVTEAANNGALSDDEIAANQLQVDSSLEAINRIAQTTTFQGRRLLDGSLDFVTKAGTGFGTVSDLQIDQANLGAAGSVNVNVKISQAATKAEINSTGIPASATATFSAGKIAVGSGAANTPATLQVDLSDSFNVGAEASGTIDFTNAYVLGGTVATTATAITLGSGTSFTVDAVLGGAADGSKGNSTKINITAGAGTTTATYNSSTNQIDIALKNGDAYSDLATAFAAISADFTITDNASAGTFVAGDGVGLLTGKFSGGADTTTPGSFNLAAKDGAFTDGTVGNNTDIVFTSGATTGAAYDEGTNKLTVTVAAGATVSSIAAAITSDVGTYFETSNISGGSSIFSSTDLTALNAEALTSGTDTTAAGQFKLVATQGGPADGTKANSTAIEFVAAATGVTSTSAAYDTNANKITFTLAAGATVQDILDAVGNDLSASFQTTGTPLNANAIFKTSELGTATATETGKAVLTVPTAGTSGLDELTITAKNGTADTNGKTISFATNNSVTAGTAVASLDNSGNIVITTNNAGKGSFAAIRNAINSSSDVGALYSASITGTSGDGNFDIGTDTPSTTALSGGASGGGLNADLVIQLTGSTGSEVFQFQKGATLSSVIQSINLVKDATGIEATDSSGDLQLTSTAYGSKSVAAIDVISEGTGGTFKSGLSASRSVGTDIQATVNGYSATGDGNTLSINTSTLDLKLTVAAGSSTAVNFDITGGGALFQLGSDVVSNQQARLGIGSLNTAKLGGSNGRLYELSSGGSKSLVNDATGAFRVIDEVINKVTSLRGRLGAFQATTLQSNSASLTDTVANLTEAESSIRDADFAAESAKLTRAQILVQSGTQVLSIANQNPQNVLSLLR